MRKEVKCIIKHGHFGRFVGLSCSGGFLLLAWLLITPKITTASSAQTITNTVSANATLNIKSTVAVSLTSSLQLELLPKAEGSFTTVTADLKVATNNVTGYSVYLTANNDSKLIASDKTNTATINPVSGIMNATNYQEHLNSWGYANITGATDDGKNSDYQAIPTTDNEALFSNTSEASEDEYRLGFATAVGIDLPAGLYQGAVTVSVVANPKEVTNLSELTYMQDMTSQICQNTMDYVDKETYATKQLIDIRDGKSYWVAKLADGNCWMVQNLGLELSPNNTLTPQDTDIQANYTPASSTNAARLVGSAINLSSNNQYSWSWGDIVLGTPLKNSSCGYDTFSNSDLGTKCYKNGFVDVSDSTYKPTMIASPGTFNGESEELVAINETTHEYDAHYLLGIYYQFNAATAGTGSAVTSMNQEATGSICPKGWQLPTSGYNSSTLQPLDKEKSYYRLLLAYGYPKTGEYTINSNSIPVATVTSTTYNPALLPVAFVNNGIVDPLYGALRILGLGASYWTSTSLNSERGYYLSTISTQVSPAAIYERNVGFTVRCLAR